MRPVIVASQREVVVSMNKKETPDKYLTRSPKLDDYSPRSDDEAEAHDTPLGKVNEFFKNCKL